MDLEKRHLRHIDWPIVLILLGLCAFSYLGISGSKGGMEFANKQILWYLFGFLIMTVILLFDYRIYHSFAYLLYGFGMLLIIVVLQTPARNGAHSWFDLGPILFQPSEIMKLFTIMALARFLAARDQKPGHFREFRQLIPPSLIVGVPMFLILIQPDLGTAMVYVGILATMLVVGGIRFRHVAVLGGLAGCFLGFMTILYHFHQDLFFKIIKPYQWSRITSWINPDLSALGDGFQLKQSLIAIGSGQLMGKGIDTPTQASYGWVPVGESDFIFTVIAEKMGFVGSSMLMILFFFLIYRMIRIALQAKDRFGTYVVAGVVGTFSFQIFENIGMTIQLMPITGITLPFISYGGSSLLTNFVIMGVVLNIGMRKQKLGFE
jgi:rod shape determining protein RodA